MCFVPCIVIYYQINSNKMHTYCVFHFTHLHVSVPLNHLEGAFCYRIYWCHNVHVQYTSIYSRTEGKILCYMLKMSKFHIR